MSYDFNILVLHQSKPVTIPFNTLITTVNEIENDCGKRYHTIWPFVTQLKGIWYSLIKENDGLVYASFCDSDFEALEDDLPIPHWINDPSISYNLTPLLIDKNFRLEIEKIILFLLDQSPIKTIMLLARYQGGDHEIINGILSFEEYIASLDKGKILFNVCYIIKK